MENKICAECGTENEKEYIYCKNCGAQLSSKKEEDTPFESTVFVDSMPQSEEPKPTIPPQSNSYSDSSFPYPYGAYSSYTIDGIPADEVAFFVGKKANDFMPKFLKMEMLRSKNSWCWPVAILGYLFGPIGAAFWFFYRKMYKTAVILLAIGALITFATSALTYNVVNESLDGIISAFSEGDADAVLSALENFEVEESLPVLIADGINSITSLVTAILMGIFSFYLYKEHCVKSIYSFRQNQTDPRYYRLGLASLGGTSGGMLTVGIISMVVVESIASIITTILSTIL